MKNFARIIYSGQRLQTLLQVVVRRNVTLHHALELLARMEGHDVAGLDGNDLARTRIAPWARGLAADLKVAKTRQLHILPFNQGALHRLEEGLDHVLGLTLVEPQPVKEHIRQLGLGQRGRFNGRQQHGQVADLVIHVHGPPRPQARTRAPTAEPTAANTACMAASMRSSVKVCSSSRNSTLTARLRSCSAMPATGVLGL